MRKVFTILSVVVAARCLSIHQGTEETTEPAIVVREAFALIGVQTWIDPETADHEGIFDNLYRPHAEKARAVASEPGFYGAYFASRGPGQVGYMVGVAAPASTTAPDGLVALAIPSARYAVFEFPREDIGKAWDYIHGEWFPNSREYALAATPVFEYYPRENTTETRLAIWVPVRPRE